MKKIFPVLVVLFLASCGKFPMPTQVGDGSLSEVYENTQTGQKIEVVKSHKAKRPRKDGEARIAFLIPLSGDKQSIGINMLDATQMAMHDLKAEHINLVPIDTAYGVASVKTRLEEEDFDLVIGPLYSQDAKDLYPLVQSKGLCMITFSNDNELRNRDCLFMLGVMPEESVKRVLTYAREKLPADIYAVLPRNKYGEVIESSIAKLNRRLEAPVTVIGRYNQESTAADMQQVAVNIKFHSSPNSALLVPEGTSSLAGFINELRSKGGAGRYKMLGSGLWDDERLYKIPELNGAWFANIPHSKRDKFEKRFMAHFDYKPSRLSSLAYDSIALVAALSKKSSNRNAFDKVAITNQAGFKGITGLFRFLPDGSNQRTMAVYEIRSDGLIQIDPAPATFQGMFRDLIAG
ncbi:MAG: penicillin-binding protein activator [Rickettsiales bacterium]